jgi:hypothetical protein
LSSLRSNVFGVAFAASQERQQYCEMRDLQANDGTSETRFLSTSSFIGLKMPDRPRSPNVSVSARARLTPKC